MTISHMARCCSLKPWMLAAGTSQMMIAKGGSDISSAFIPGASPWIISDAMLMKTCGLTVKIAEIRYSHFAILLFFFLFYHTVNSISTVSPVVNTKGQKNDLLFTGMLLNVNKFPTKKFWVKNDGLHANTCKTEA